jgi:amino acid permease
MKFTLPVAICFTLNYTIGSGFLTLPWAFCEAGLVMGPVVLFILAIFAFCTSWMVLEAMARATAIADLQAYADGEDVQDLSNKPLYGSLATKDSSAGNGASSSGNGSDRSDSKVATASKAAGNGEPWVIGKRRIEMPDLCETFLGPMGKTLYMISLVTYAYGSMWAYSTVFANSWAKVFPIGDYAVETSYKLYLALWALVEIPWSTMELEEQIFVQVTLTVGRIVLVIVMVSTVLYCDNNSNNSFLLQKDGTMGLGAHTDAHDTVSSTTGGSFVDWDTSHLYIIMAISIYANNLHHSVNTLVTPLEDKRQSGLLFVASFTITTLSYIFLGVTLATYFGSYIPSSSNLTWSSYVGVDPAAFFSTGQVPFYAQVISAFVVLFPSIDVASTFPLLAVTLGNGLMTVTYPDPKDLEKARESVSTVLLYRVVAATPPIVGAFFVSNLGSVTAYTGLTGVFISLVFPAALAVFSKAKMEQMGLPSATLWSHGLSHAIGIFVLVGGMCSAAYILSRLLIDGVPSGLE